MSTEPNISAEEWQRRLSAYMANIHNLTSNELQEHIAMFSDAEIEKFVTDLQTARSETIAGMLEAHKRIGTLLSYWEAALHAVESVRIARRNAAAATARHGVN